MRKHNDFKSMHQRLMEKKVARIEVRVPDEFYNLVAEVAERDKINLGEVLARAFAEQIGADEESWKVEKDRPGRKPKMRVA